MIKKIVIITLLFTFLITDSLVADENYNIKSLITFLTLGTGSITGTYYPLGLAFANVMSSKIKDVDVMALSTNGSKENIRLLEKHELKLAIAQSDTFYNAVNGLGDFKNEKYDNLRAILSLYPEVVQIIVPNKSEIHKIEDLKGKRVILGAKGSGNAATAINILSIFNIKIGDIVPGYLSYDEVIGNMEEKNYDAFFLVAGLPTKIVKELKSRFRVRILQLTDGEIGKICSKLKYMSPAIINGNTYVDQGSKINTVALKALLITTSELSEKIVNKLVKTIFENLDYFKQMHPRAQDISIKSYKEAIPEKFLHRGSKSYYDKNIRGKLK